jgi:hypothetical protein
VKIPYPIKSAFHTFLATFLPSLAFIFLEGIEKGEQIGVAFIFSAIIVALRQAVKSLLSFIILFFKKNGSQKNDDRNA